MKKTLLATAILAGLVSATAQSATVYDEDGTTLKIGGRAEVRADFLGDDFEKIDGSIQDKSRARINFGGKTKITETLSGFGFMEYEIKPSTKDGSDLDNRYLFAGLSTQVGDFSYGKQDAANVQISDITDIATYHSGIQQVIGAAKDKRENNFLYSNTFANALTVQADYIASSDDDEDSYGLSALYVSNFGLDLGVSYSDAQDDSNQTTFAAAYTINDLYVAVSYAVGDVDADTDFTSLEAAIQYKFTKKFRMIGIIGQQEEEVSGSDTDTEDFYAIEAQYRFNKSIRTYVSYAYNDLDDADKTEDSLVAGIRYNF